MTLCIWFICIKDILSSSSSVYISVVPSELFFDASWRNIKNNMFLLLFFTGFGTGFCDAVNILFAVGHHFVSLLEDLPHSQKED